MHCFPFLVIASASCPSVLVVHRFDTRIFEKRAKITKKSNEKTNRGAAKRNNKKKKTYLRPAG